MRLSGLSHQHLWQDRKRRERPPDQRWSGEGVQAPTVHGVGTPRALRGLPCSQSHWAGAKDIWFLCKKRARCLWGV